MRTQVVSDQVKLLLDEQNVYMLLKCDFIDELIMTHPHLSLFLMKTLPLLMIQLGFGNPDVIQASDNHSHWVAKDTNFEATQTAPPVAAPPIYTETQDGRTFSLHSSGKVASIQVSSAVMDRWNSSTQGFNDASDRNTLTQAIYGFVEDDFDFIFFVNNNEEKPSSIPYFGQLISVSRSITGITRFNNFDNTSSTGSAGRLQSYIHLPYFNAIQQGPTLHELAHNWANFFQNFELASPSGNFAALPHWGWTSIPGQLGGFDPSTLEDLGGGNWKAASGIPGRTSFGGTANGGNSLPYANWELYLMGLMPVDSLYDITYFTEIVTDAERVGQGEFSGTLNTYTVNQFLADRGPRVPAFGDAPTNFTTLFVVVTDTPLSDSEWAAISEQVEWLTFEGNDASSLYNFYEATRGVGTLNPDISNSLINGEVSISIKPNEFSQLRISESPQQWEFHVKSALTVYFYDVQGNKQTFELAPGTHFWEKGHRTYFVQFENQGQMETFKIIGK